MNKFWEWVKDKGGSRSLRLDGPIDSETLWGGENGLANSFREELGSDRDDITVYINSPGGDVFAAAEIYTMLHEHSGKVTVKIESIAASAASVIAMAGDTVLMSPVAMLMIHDPWTMAIGNASEMKQVIARLKEVKESIINAYVAKTGSGRGTIATLMENETWMNANKAIEFGFADGLIERKGGGEKDGETAVDIGSQQKSGQLYSQRVMESSLINRLFTAVVSDIEEPAKKNPVSGVLIGLDGRTENGAMPYLILIRQLELLK